MASYASVLTSFRFSVFCSEQTNGSTSSFCSDFLSGSKYLLPCKNDNHNYHCYCAEHKCFLPQWDIFLYFTSTEQCRLLIISFCSRKRFSFEKLGVNRWQGPLYNCLSSCCCIENRLYTIFPYMFSMAYLFLPPAFNFHEVWRHVDVIEADLTQISIVVVERAEGKKKYM